MRRNWKITIVSAVILAIAVSAQGQGLNSGLLEVKDHFQSLEDAAVAEKFVGIQLPTGMKENLFPLRTTGVSTGPVRIAANDFLSLLNPPQLIRSHFPVTDLEWRRWLNVDNGIYSRTGTPLIEMNAEQREAAMKLLSETLSARGLEQSEAIMLTDQALKELNPESADYLDPDLYYFTVMGTPSATEPWGWQLDGHHLVINAFFLGDQMVMTPSFWGGEPAISVQGTTNGNAVLQTQQDLALTLVRSLSPAQLPYAIIDAEKTGDNMLAGAFQDNLVLDYAGLAASDMTEVQRESLRGLLESYIGAMRDSHATIKMEEIDRHLDQTYFAWIGATDNNSVFYYRIHSPVVLIEFDHQTPVGTAMLHTRGEPTRDHIHTVVRTPNGNDYGRDLLAQHLARAHGQ